MSPKIVGLFAGLLITIAAMTGGFVGFLLAIVLGAVGWVVGAAMEGQLDVMSWFAGRRRG